MEPDLRGVGILRFSFRISSQMVLDVNIKIYNIVIAILVFYADIVLFVIMDRICLTIQRGSGVNPVTIAIKPAVFKLGLIIGLQGCL